MIEPGLVIFVAIGVAMTFGALIEGSSILINKMLEDKTPDHPDKYETYECGELTIGDPTKVKYTVNFYPYLVAFLVAEVAGLIALVSAAYPTVNALIAVSMVFFALLVGIAWLRKIGVMSWMR